MGSFAPQPVGRRFFGNVVVVMATMSMLLIVFVWSSRDLSLTSQACPVIVCPIGEQPIDDQITTGPVDPAEAPSLPSPAPILAPIAVPVSSPDPLPVAFIIEDNMSKTLVPLILHFALVLGSGWKIILYTIESRWVPPPSAPWRRAVAAGHIEVRFLPDGTQFQSGADVSNFLTKPWVWEQLADAPHTLMFQLDSIICSHSEATVDDFLEYDFIGAPIALPYGQGYNGGLSLRNPRLFLQIIRETSFEGSSHKFEDQWFFAELKLRGAHMPAEDVASNFSVEALYNPRPLGYHQPHRWQVERIGEIEEWCPEVKLLLGRRAM